MPTASSTDSGAPEVPEIPLVIPTINNMYTATLKTNEVDKEARRRILTVEFTDGTDTFTKNFQFTVEELVVNMKKIVKQYLDELNYVPEEITGDIADYTEPVEATPSQTELDKTQWEKDKATLIQVEELIGLGVFDGTETAVVNLRNKVKTDFKISYLN